MEGTGEEGKGISLGGNMELSQAESPNATTQLSDAGAEGAVSADEERRDGQMGGRKSNDIWEAWRVDRTQVPRAFMMGVGVDAHGELLSQV